MLLKVCDAMSAEENWDELRFHGVGWGTWGERGGTGKGKTLSVSD